MRDRTDQEWLADLRAAGGGTAQADLRALLGRALRRELAGRADAATLDDLTQEATLAVLAGIEGFRGDSRFLTWAVAVAVRAAFAHLRLARWRRFDPLPAGAGAGDADPIDPAAGPDRQAHQRAVLAVLRRVLAEELTDRQRQVMEALLRGEPKESIAPRLGVGRNAVYKLAHDARAKLRHGLLAAGITADDVLWGFNL